MDLDFKELEKRTTWSRPVDFSLANDCNIDLSEELLAPEILISIGEHEYKDKMYPTAAMTAGNFRL
jgi:hypothetical protein